MCPIVGGLYGLNFPFLMDMDNGVVIVGWGGEGSRRGPNGNGKNTIKISKLSFPSALLATASSPSFVAWADGAHERPVSR